MRRTLASIWRLIFKVVDSPHQISLSFGAARFQMVDLKIDDVTVSKEFSRPKLERLRKPNFLPLTTTRFASYHIYLHVLEMRRQYRNILHPLVS